jgi:hypothetical protein
MYITAKLEDSCTGLIFKRRLTILDTPSLLYAEVTDPLIDTGREAAKTTKKRKRTDLEDPFIKPALPENGIL